MPGKKEIDDFSDVASDERVIRVHERFSRAEERKKMYEKLSKDMETRLKKERDGPRPVMSKVQRDIHHAEIEWRATQGNLDDLKLQCNIRRAEIARAQDEFRHLIHKDVDLEKPVELDKTRMESAKKKLEAKVKRITKEIAGLEKQIPSLIQGELIQRGRLENLKIQRESIKSGFRDLPIEKDPRMTSFHRERFNIDKEYDDIKQERDDIVRKVRTEKKRAQKRQPSKSPGKESSDKREDSR
ncbi:MAG: hypothetical protein ACFFER_10615 [Candidatus Thorarchaeota archaeon]